VPAQPVERKLAAIFAADIAGYSRLMARDEVGTLARLKSCRVIIDELIASHRGRIFNTAGDSVIADFASAVDAVQCAVAVQAAIATENAGRSADARMEFRIGVHVGDVIVDGANLLGDGVNIAARIEAVADPGAICVSAAVRDQVGNKLPVAFDDLGDQQVKNIAQAIRVYHVLAEPRPLPATTLALPDKPSIAVLAFANLSGDPDQEYFADGMVEDIITGLSRIKWLFVIARNSTFVYKGRTIDMKQVGRELGVRYVLEGSVRKLGNRVRITSQLIDATTGAHVWAERYDRALDDIFDLQDELTISVVGAIEPTLRQAEVERAKRKRPDSLDAYDLYLRALPNAFTSMPETADKALPLLEQAITIEPDYAAAHAAIALCHHARYQRAGLREDEKITALHHARLAMATGGDDATALAVAAFVIGANERDYSTAFSAFDRALALSPSSALALSLSALIRAWAGDDTDAIDQAEQALRLSPFDTLIYLPYLGLAYGNLFAGHFEEAALAASRCEQANPRFSPACYVRVAALVNLGRNDEARASVQRLLDLWPGFAISRIANFTSPERLAILANALRRAGLPET
jgi:TolB-like protein